MCAWAIDLGTTNTGVARWDAQGDRPRLVELPDICRRAGGDNHLEAPRLVPSATDLLDEAGFKSRFGRWRFMARRFFVGRWAWIGRQAQDRNLGHRRPSYAPSWKRFLGHSPFRILARAGSRSFTTRDVARTFARELLAEIKRTHGERVKELVLTAPVDSYESYRAELAQIFKGLGVKTVRFIDEPVAAALGYGLSMRQQRMVLVVDFGGGTLDLALVELTAKGIHEGACEVIAKEGRAIGGNLVDRWLLNEFCERLDFPLREEPEDERTSFWFDLMRAEACRVKEAVFFKEREHFTLTPPEDMRAFEARIRGDTPELEVDKEMLVAILKERGLYRILEECIDGIATQARGRGISEDDIAEVLMVGGSTLLPGVFPLFERRYGRGRVRAWQPFEAVAFGAAAYAADRFAQSDFIVHDYAFVTHDLKTHEPQYTVIVPRGTRFPTSAPVWKRQLVPTCSLGEPETMFKLVISEIGRATDGERRFGWDASGQLHKLGGASGSGEDRLVVALNEANPTLGYLKPPHPPSDKTPRLEIAFGVNANRWLVATVRDLRTQKELMRDEPVVKLL